MYGDCPSKTFFFALSHAHAWYSLRRTCDTRDLTYMSSMSDEGTCPKIVDSYVNHRISENKLKRDIILFVVCWHWPFIDA